MRTARFSGRRAVVVIAAAVIVVGGASAGLAAAMSSGNGAQGPSGGAGPVTTAPVVRTNLTTSVQVGGSMGYGGFYGVVAPSGTSPATISQDEQTISADQQALSADEQTASDTSSSGSQSVSAARTSVSLAQSTLNADVAAERKACAGSGASSAACSQDQQKASADRSALAQAEQQLVAAESTAKSGDDQAQGKVGADRVKLNGDDATLAMDRATQMDPGTAYTWLPASGSVIKEDQRVFSVSNEPVPLLYGSITAYRAFYAGMSDGADVGELTHDLITLGYGDGLTQSNHYSSATAAAVERWQLARGLPATGEILLGAVVFESGPMRVTSVSATVGSSYGGGGGGGTPGGSGGGGSGGSGGGTVLTATGTTPVVTVDLPVTQEYLVKPGDAVSVVLPSGTSTVGGHVESVGNVATCPGGSGTGTGGGSGGSGGSPCSSSGSSSSGSGSGSSSTPTVPVTISLDSAPAGAALDQAPVNVNITSQTVDNVLAVPVNALLALQGGGYGLDVVSGGTAHLVGVSTGMYSNTLVEISGAGIAVGMKVQVPSS